MAELRALYRKALAGQEPLVVDANEAKLVGVYLRITSKSRESPVR